MLCRSLPSIGWIELQTGPIVCMASVPAACTCRVWEGVCSFVTAGRALVSGVTCFCGPAKTGDFTIVIVLSHGGDLGNPSPALQTIPGISQFCFTEYFWSDASNFPLLPFYLVPKHGIVDTLLSAVFTVGAPRTPRGELLCTPGFEGLGARGRVPRGAEGRGGKRRMLRGGCCG